MKQKFSKSWQSSVQVRKQRKYRYNAPLHVKHRFLSALLSKELKKKHGKRNAPIRKGDEVLIMRGNFAKKSGKVLEIDLKRSRLTVDGITRSKKDGTKINAFLNPSNLRIISLSLDDSKRLKRNRKFESTANENKPEAKTEKVKEEKKENAPEKNTSK